MRTSYLLFVILLSACSAKPMPEAMLAIELQNVFQNSDYYRFTPASSRKKSCIIFYPGGLVEPVAYAPYMQALAAQGYYAYLLKLTLDLAVLDADAADEARQDKLAQQHCQKFLIAGHSLGGTMAVDYVMEQAKTNNNHALLLLAAYPQSSTVIKSHSVPVLSISGSNDLLVTAEDIDNAKHQLPESTDYFVIEGGNHAQFGWYGPQDKDGVASITREQQQLIIIEKTLDLLNRLESPAD